MLSEREQRAGSQKTHRQRIEPDPSLQANGICCLRGGFFTRLVELYHSAGDADYDMSTPCTMAKRRSVAVVGVDADLLVLLLHHLSSRHHVIFLQTASSP